MWADDDTLLDALGQALTTATPALTEPSEAEMDAFLAVVANLTGQDEQPLAPIVSIQAANARHRWAPRLMAAAGAMAVLASAGTAAAATGAVPLPRPIRAVAYEIGLPVDSPELADVKSSLAALRRAMQKGDQEAIAAAQAKLDNQLTKLNPSEIHDVHRQLDDPNAGVGANGPDPSTTPLAVTPSPGPGGQPASPPSASIPPPPDTTATSPADPPTTGAVDPSATNTTPTDPSTIDTTPTDPSPTDPSATDPSATDPSATDPSATDPSATDPSATTPPTDPSADGGTATTDTTPTDQPSVSPGGAQIKPM